MAASTERLRSLISLERFSLVCALRGGFEARENAAGEGVGDDAWSWAARRQQQLQQNLDEIQIRFVVFE